MMSLINPGIGISPIELDLMTKSVTDLKTMSSLMIIPVTVLMIILGTDLVIILMIILTTVVVTDPESIFSSEKIVQSY